MLGFCIFGVLVKIMLDIIFSRLIKASDNMGTTNNKFTQMMKKKFETCYKLKIGVNNVDIFVDKYVYRYKFGGILLSTWENIGVQILMLCLLTGSVSSLLGLIYGCGKNEILSTFSVGILTSALLILIEGFMNNSGKKDVIRLNMKDYLENFFKVRLEQEAFHPELIEQYKKELLLQGEGGQVLGSVSYGSTEKSEKEKKAAERAEKQLIKKQQKEAMYIEKKNKKIAAKEAKENEKNARQLEIDRKKEEKVQRKLEEEEIHLRLKKEAELALEKKREDERAEIELKKAEAKALDERNKEEKRRQEEIKKALLIEKQSLKEEKQKVLSEHKKTTEHKGIVEHKGIAEHKGIVEHKSIAEHRSIAQERKENLKKEIQERRSMNTDQEHEKENIQKESTQKENIQKESIQIDNEETIGKPQTTLSEEKTMAEPVTSEEHKNKSSSTASETAKAKQNKVTNEANKVKADTKTSEVMKAKTGTTEHQITKIKPETAVSEVIHIIPEVDMPSKNTKTQIKPLSGKKQKPLDPSEEKLIEDILKEFLA